MTSFIDPTPSEPCSAKELEMVEHFIREQAAVVMRAARMEVKQTLTAEPPQVFTSLLLPWLENQYLRGQLETYRQGSALQLILEQQLLLALTYLNDPDENTRDYFVNGSFKAIYACEKFHYGEIASKNIVDIVNRLGLQDYG
jgi:hypothetical protein